MFQAEYEPKLNKMNLHIYLNQEYEEDYQVPMLQQNKIAGLLSVEGCEVEGRSRYTYDTKGMVTMYSMYEKKALQRKEIQQIVEALLKIVEELQKYLLQPDCLILNPKYIFHKEGTWYFCYLPDWEGKLNQSFHELTEYFVKTLDYGDTDGIFLAYELHKATLQEHYDLAEIMGEYELHEEERNKMMEEWKEEHENYGNVFSLSDEEEEYETTKNSTLYENYQIFPKPDTVREEGGAWRSWRKAAKRVKSNRWGSWNDLITEGEDEV